MSKIVNADVSLAKLATFGWEPFGRYIRLRGYVNDLLAENIKKGLSPEAQDALCFSIVDGKIMLKRNQAEAIFKLEGLPLNIQDHGKTI